MIDYSQMSDRDIDAQVLQKIYGNQASDKDIMRAWLRGGFKYTTNPSDAWPIIIENKIAIIPDSADGEWVAFNEFTLYEGDWMFASDPERHVNGSNPLRAAMIVFLMMKDAENAPAI